jgi:hypothetical protein
MLIDMIDDIFCLLDLLSFHHLSKYYGKKHWFGWASWGLNIANSFLIELIFHSGPQELIDIDISGDERVKIVCKLI